MSGLLNYLGKVADNFAEASAAGLFGGLPIPENGKRALETVQDVRTRCMGMKNLLDEASRAISAHTERIGAGPCKSPGREELIEQRRKLIEAEEEKIREGSAQRKILSTTRSALPMRSTIRSAESTSHRSRPANPSVQEDPRTAALIEWLDREEQKIREGATKRRNPPATRSTLPVQQAKPTIRSAGSTSHRSRPANPSVEGEPRTAVLIEWLDREEQKIREGATKRRNPPATRSTLPVQQAKPTVRSAGSTSHRSRPANPSVQGDPRRAALIEWRQKLLDREEQKIREGATKRRNLPATRSTLPVQQAKSTSQQSQTTKNRSVQPDKSNNSVQSQNNHCSSDENLMHSCPICFEDFREIKSGAVMTECNHIFCKKCIENVPPSREGVLHCPMCRRGIKNLRIISSFIRPLHSRG